MDYNDNELEENTVKLNISKKVEDEEIICEDCSADKKTKNLVGAHKEKMSKFVFNTFNAKGLRSKN